MCFAQVIILLCDFPQVVIITCVFVQVMRGVDGYYDIIWADINIEKINAELTEFQNKYDSGL